MADKLGYKVCNAGTTVVKSNPAGFYGLIVTASSSGSITVYDNASSASGNILYAKTALAVGADLIFSGIGMAAANGITVVITGATVNILYT